MKLKVCYPDGGKRFILHWWTYDERGHVVIAKSKRGLFAAAERVFERHPDTEIKSISEVEIVGPPKRLHKLAEKWERAEQVSSFHIEFCARLSDAKKHGIEIPAPFAECTSRSSKNSIDHSGCLCQGTLIRLVGITPTQFYDRYHASWRAFSPTLRGLPNSKHVLSRAKAASDTAAIWYAGADFGHHADGIVLKKVSLREAKSYRPAYLTDRLLFFFRPIRDLDCKSLRATLAEKKEAARRRSEEYEKKRVKEFQRARRNQVEEVVRFFKHAEK